MVQENLSKKTKFLFGDSEKGFTFAAAKSTAGKIKEILEWSKGQLVRF